MDKRTMIIISVGVMGIFVIILGIWLVFFNSGRDQGANVLAPVPSKPSLEGLPQAGLQDGTSGTVQQSQSQGGLAVSGTRGSISDLPQLGDEGAQIGNVSDVAQGGYTAITPTTPSGSFQNIAISGDGSVRYYDQSKGQFVEVSLDQKTQYLSQDAFPSAKQVVWSQSGDKAVVEFPDGYNIIYDFAHDKQVTLPKEAEGFSFSPSSQEVAYKMMTTDFWQNWLAVSSTDGESIQNVEHLGDNGVLVRVDWSPNNQVIAFYTKGETGDTQKIYPLGKNQENLPALRVAGRGFEEVWAPTGDKLLYSVRSETTNHNPTLWITDARPETMGENNVPLYVQTWAEKCVFRSNGESVICAVPQELPQGSGLFPELAKKIPEDFYEIDIFTGKTTLLAKPVGAPPGLKATDLHISSDGKDLIFRDSTLGGVYRMGLE
ncbi:MAG: hypothetical protein A2986_03515 [Candidatus Jacksonbacteria bacterium RIFCSPLOWO2_01_FULL_44_13]|nr:MAG: hypothetical protein A2986_03515 [Candidatus Jacksonbacteria bacterium RIFCSPLOWO2_01_FULL_44_13]